MLQMTLLQLYTWYIAVAIYQDGNTSSTDVKKLGPMLSTQGKDVDATTNNVKFQKQRNRVSINCFWANKKI